MKDMLVRLYDLQDYSALEAKLAGEGIEVRRALAPERRLVARWAADKFSELWASEIEVAFGRQPIACHVATLEGRIVGFACHDTTARGFFGPTGVDPSVRSRGVGKVLLWRALRGLWELGYAYGIIGGVGPADFYRKAVGAVMIEGSNPGIYRGLLK